MKKRFLSAILVLTLMISGLTFSACSKKEEGYDLSTIVTDYKEQISHIANINVLTDNSIEFDYSVYEYNDVAYLSDLINTYAPYTYLQSYYNQLLNNSMQFVYSYIEVCSKDTIKAPANLKNEVKNDLDELVSSLRKTSGYVDAVADKIRKGNPALESESLNSLKNLFDSYDELYQSAFNFSTSISKVYYNYALIDPNPDYSGTDVNNYDSSKSVLLLTSRTKSQISNLTQTYVEINLKGTNLSSQFTAEGNIAGLPTSFNQYNEKINAITYDIDDTLAIALNSSAYKQEFLNKAITLYNCICTLDNDSPIYLKASNEIIYNKVINDPNATRYELVCAEIVENHAYIVDEMNTIIANMINILKNVDTTI